MGCTFCMTATLGLVRNLSAGEIVAQVHAVNREVRKNENLELNRPLTNLVFMGMGEPLLNLDNVLPALRILLDEAGMGFAPRRVAGAHSRSSGGRTKVWLKLRLMPQRAL